jgi:hypothetical protein
MFGGQPVNPRCIAGRVCAPELGAHGRAQLWPNRVIIYQKLQPNRRSLDDVRRALPGGGSWSPNRRVPVRSGTTAASKGTRRHRRHRSLPSIAESRSGGATFVVVVQPAEVPDLDDHGAAGRWLHRPRNRRVLRQGQVRAPVMVVRDVPLEVTA